MLLLNCPFPSLRSRYKFSLWRKENLCLSSCLQHGTSDREKFQLERKEHTHTETGQGSTIIYSQPPQQLQLLLGAYSQKPGKDSGKQKNHLRIQQQQHQGLEFWERNAPKTKIYLAGVGWGGEKGNWCTFILLTAPDGKTFSSLLWFWLPCRDISLSITLCWTLFLFLPSTAPMAQFYCWQWWRKMPNGVNQATSMAHKIVKILHFMGICFHT